MKASTVFKKTYQAYAQEDIRYVINEGGARSGKSYSILQLLLYLAINAKEPLLISCCSESYPHLRRGIIRDFENILKDKARLIEGKHYKVNKTENIYTFNDKGQIEFFSVDSPSKVLGPQRDILFINEANHIAYETFVQLDVRTKSKVFIDYNPSARFWAMERLMPLNETVTIHSTYKDNPFLSSEQKRAIEAQRSNENWWRVYGEGLLGEVEGQIYHYETVDDLPEDGAEVYGVDFGFTNDPTAIVHLKVFSNRKEVYVDEICYRNQMLNADIIKQLKINNVDKRTEIYADCAEPKTIAEINKAGYNIKPCTKGGSNTDKLLFQIQWVQGWNIFVTKRSLNVIKELNNYLWLKDINGNSINKPMDSFNHSLDAIRYGLFTKFGKQSTGNYNLGF